MAISLWWVVARSFCPGAKLSVSDGEVDNGDTALRFVVFPVLIHPFVMGGGTSRQFCSQGAFVPTFVTSSSDVIDDVVFCPSSMREPPDE